MKPVAKSVLACRCCLGVFAVLLMAAVANAETATVVWYLEQEPGIEPFKVRYIVTPEFLRGDEGEGSEGFVLLVRNEQRIYNVVPEDRVVLEIDGRGEAPAVPASLSLEIKEAHDESAPRFEGKSALTLELFANGERCRTAVVVPGVLDDSRRAFEEFQRVLAVQQGRTLGNTPEEFRTPCFLADTVYATRFQFERGMPLLEWAADHPVRELLHYETGVDLPRSLFTLPADYRRMAVPGG